MRLTLLFLFSALHVSAAHPYFENNFYAFYFKANDNSVCLVSAAGDTIVSSTSFYQYLIEDSTGDTLKLKASARSNYFSPVDGAPAYTWIDSTPYCLTIFTAVFSPQSEEINITTESRYKKDVQVLRDVFVLNLAQPLEKVFRKNTLCDTANFQDEYWLNKEGARFGLNGNSFLVYHLPGISSLQLNVPQNQLLINLDYCKDHPFQHFPQRDSMMNVKEDLSCNHYKAGDVRKNSFVLHAGKRIDFVPRLMLNPGGFLAAHVFTEHADWTDLPTHHAVYFGSEEITEAKNAVGGFIKNKIPVTKSVFYSNPDKVMNNQSTHKSIFSTPVANIKGTKNYLEFLKQLQEEGDEICLHTPDHFTSRTALVEEACSFMKKNFNSVTWIDHGYNNGPKNNREAFVCDGLYPRSASYAKDSWEKYGVKYFWNSYYEDFVTEDSTFFDFNGSIMHPYPGFGDAAPTPLYWQCPTRTENFYSWPTRDLLEMPVDDAWNFHFSTERLNDFVQQRAVKFEHCYPAGSIEGSGYWKYNSEKKLVVDPQFEKALEQLASYRDRGLINLTTVRDLLGYWIACERIRFTYPDSGTVKITNENQTELKAVSFAVAANKISADKEIQQKNSGRDLIFWMDMKAGESVVLKFSN
jgi:hypothetical protein